jgi:predicted Zn-dependent protease
VSGSFRVLSSAEKAALKPLRIRVVTVRPGQTMGTLAAQMVGVDRKLDLFKVLNAIGPAGNVSTGDKVKIITDR